MMNQASTYFNKMEIKQLKRRIKKDHNSYEANLQLGIHYYQKNEIQQAVSYLEKVYEIKHDRTDIMFILAMSHRILGNQSISDQYFRKAITVEPSNFKFLYNYGLFLNENKQFEDAVNIFNKALLIRPDNYELLNDIGVIYYNKQKYDKAIETFRKALSINKDYLIAQINLAYAYFDIRNLSSAERIIERIEAVQPLDPEVRELRRRFNTEINRSNKKHGDYQNEFNILEKRLKISPLKMISKFSENGKIQNIGLSIIIPVKDERENIPILYKEIAEILNELKEDSEILFIDDGSTDGSEEALAHIAKNDNRVKIIKFRRNYGQTAAMNAGFKYSRGHVVITIDGDLQNDPADIPKLLEKMAEGYDLVSGWRKDRHDTLITRKIPSMVANKMINKLIEGTDVQLHDFGCTLKAYKRGVIKNIQLYGEMHRFIPVFAAWLGVKVAEIPVNHRPRKYGVAKYNLSRISRVIFDLIVVRFFSDYMTRPIQFFGKIAKKLLGTGLVTIILLFCTCLYFKLNLSINTLILLIAILFLSSLQILFAGLLGEIIMRSFFEGQKKDYYVVERIINDGTNQ